MQYSGLKIPNLILCIWAMLFFSLVVPAQTPDEKNIQQVLSAQETENLIHAGDLIDVDVVGSTEFDWRGTLTPEGFLDGLNFVDEPVFALCRTEAEVAAEVVKGYEKTLRNPQIVVKIIDRSRRPVSLLYGAIKTPQRFQVRRPVKLNELLILAGGITDRASGDIQILRTPSLSCAAKNNQSASAGNPQKESNGATSNQSGSAQYINVKISDLLKGKPGANPLILTGDVITVSESKPIYVTGGVVAPKQIDARAEISVTRAIAAAGGLAKNADPKRVTVFRTENKTSRAIEVDLDKIKSGTAVDLPLLPYDIVEVAQKGRDKGKYVAAQANNERDKTDFQKLPLRIIE